MIELTFDQAEKMLQPSRIREISFLTASPGSDRVAGLAVLIENSSGSLEHLRIVTELDNGCPVMKFLVY